MLNKCIPLTKDSDIFLKEVAEQNVCHQAVILGYSIIVLNLTLFLGHYIIAF